MKKFDPNKPFEVVDPSQVRSKKPAPKFDPRQDFEEVAQEDIKEEPGFFSEALETGINILDIPGAASRSIIMGKGKEHLKNIMDEGLIDASGMAPTEEDLAKRAGIIDEESGWGSKLGASVGVGMATDPTTYTSFGLVPLAKNALKKSLKRPMAKQAAKALAKIKPLTKSEAIGSGVSTDVMAESLLREDLARYIKKPSRLLEVLGGRRPVQTISTSAGDIIKKGKDYSNVGKISEISDDLGETIADLSTQTKGIPKKKIADPVSSEIRDLAEGKVSGVRYSPQELDSMEQGIYDLIDSDSYSLDDLYRLKKNIGKQLSSPIFFQPADKALSNNKEVMLRLQRRLDGLIEENLRGSNLILDGKKVNAADYYRVQNNRMHNLINIRDVLQMIPEKELRDSSMGANLLGLATQGAIGGTAGAVIGSLTDMPHGMMSGALLTGGMAAARQGGRAVTKNLPENLTRGMDITQRYAPTTIPFAPQGARELRPEEGQMGRQPQSVMRDNLPMQIVKTKLPRTVEGILENKEVLLAKVAQQMPQYLEQVKFVVEERPEDIEQMMPMVMQLVPHAFESDKYGRINGKILDPIMQQKAREDIMEDSRLSNTQRINMIDRLNRTNELEGY